MCKDSRILKSNWKRITARVPQCSILGPLLCILYINNLPKNVPNALILYADDESRNTVSEALTEL